MYTMVDKAGVENFAFFDIDGTIFRWTLFGNLMDEIFARSLFPETAKKRYYLMLNRWQEREQDFDSFLQDAVKIFYDNLPGVPTAKLYQIGTQIVEKHYKKTHIFPREFIKVLKEKGFTLVALSFSFDFIVEDFAKKFNFDQWYSTKLETDKSGKIFTGKILNKSEIFNKGKMLENIIKPNKQNSTLGKIIAVGDTKSDISMLEKADIPIAFNPDKELFKAAKTNNWQVVVERKNVIYSNVSCCNNLENVREFAEGLCKWKI